MNDFSGGEIIRLLIFYLSIKLLYSVYSNIFQVLRAAEAGVHVITPHCDLISQAVLLVGDDSLSTAQQSVNLLASLGNTFFVAPSLKEQSDLSSQ